jgi:cyclophilin family peptidyl-prolyl cis-trans isomerase
MYTNDASATKSTRDVQNEKPRAAGANKQKNDKTLAATGTTATLHTTYGDITIRLFPDAAPKAVENFVTHGRNNYYNNVIFHRVIRKFMIQTGDPLGDGTGGESIWGKEFADEFSNLKHDKPYTVSMANAGPNSNGSQFFITTEKTVSLHPPSFLSLFLSLSLSLSHSLSLTINHPTMRRHADCELCVALARQQTHHLWKGDCRYGRYSQDREHQGVQGEAGGGYQDYQCLHLLKSRVMGLST